MRTKIEWADAVWNPVTGFTGKEILDDPFRVASEIIACLITGISAEELIESVKDYERIR